jgi:NADPH2:quinone reductase
MGLGSISLTRPTLVDFMLTREEFLSRCNDIFTWMQQGKLKLSIDKVFSLNEAAEAHTYLESK